MASPASVSSRGASAPDAGAQDSTGLTAAELTAWLHLTAGPAPGPAALRRLLAAFGSPDAVLSASPAARHAVARGTADGLSARPSAAARDRIERTLAWLAAAPADCPRAVIPLGDPRYPALLLQSADPPFLLHTEGRTELLQAPGLAMVGSRHATAQGAATARDFAGQLGSAGLAIVSGLALGIDGAAHAGALDRGAATVAIVGTGLDEVYPSQHAALAQRVRRHGLIVSEYPLGTPPRRHQFPQRNRLIAGLTRGTLVVEAALASGSLITARLAAELGREVFAIPGSIHSPQSRGCHALLKQGATLVEAAADVLEGLGWSGAAPSTAGDSPRTASPHLGSSTSDPVLVALAAFDPVDLDTLVARTGSPAHALNARLLELEFEGRVARLPGQRYQRLASA